jgi:hypothetical protein
MLEIQRFSNFTITKSSFDGFVNTASTLAFFFSGHSRESVILKICFLLCHFPMNSEFFVPWTIYELSREKLRIY